MKKTRIKIKINKKTDKFFIDIIFSHFKIKFENYI